LGLWSNETGTYDPNHLQLFKSPYKNAGGKEVKYKVLSKAVEKDCPVNSIVDPNTKSAELFFYRLRLTERTQKYEIIMRYVLQIYNGHDYGVKLEDVLNIFKDLTEVNNNIIGGSIQEKVWFALKNLTDNEYAIAGAMGNIDYESAGFNPSVIEGGTGEGIGLCQWSYGRKADLIAYAASQGKDWKDEDIQVKFLVAELSGGRIKWLCQKSMDSLQLL